MNKLILGNLLHRPLRSLLSLSAVAIEIAMILCITAVMLGILNDNKARTDGRRDPGLSEPDAARPARRSASVR